MASVIVGSKVIIRGNDFVSQDISAAIVTIDADNKTVLLKLDELLNHTSTTYGYVVAAPRLSKDDLGVLIVDRILGCSVTWVPDDKYNPNDPMNLTWWRGGAAAITDLCIN
jgi:hypothetical protein